MEKIFDTVFKFATLFSAVILVGLALWASMTAQPPLMIFCAALLSGLAIFFSTLDVKSWLKK